MSKQATIKNNILDSFVNNNNFDNSLKYSEQYSCLFQNIDNKYWTPADQNNIKRIIFNHIRTFFKEDVALTMAIINDIYIQLQYYVETINIKDDHYISFNDKLYNTETFEFEDYDNKKISTLYIPYNSDQIINSHPNFDYFIKSSLVYQEDVKKHDESLAMFLQEITGYLLTNSMKAVACFFLVGQGSNGKSVFTDIIESIFDKEYRCSMSIQSLTMDQFGSSALVGKKINICQEEESKYIRSDKFKAMISGESITGERKFEGSFTFKPNTKFIFCSNNMPTFSGLSHGLLRRIKIVPFYRIFEDNDDDKDIYLADKLKDEIPGIIGWAIEGLKRLVKNNYVFSDNSESLTRIKEEFKNDMSSSLMFFNEEYELDNKMEEWESNDDMYSFYKDWCIKNGRKPLGSQNFHQDILNNVKNIQTRVGKDKDRKSIRFKNVKRKNFYMLNQPEHILRDKPPF